MKDVVIAIGQTLRRDDGAAAKLLPLVEWPESCRLRVLPQLVPELVEDLAGASRVLFIDAAIDRTTPTLEPVGKNSSSGSFSHFSTPEGLLRLCLLLFDRTPVASLLRLPAFDLGLGEELSSELQVQLPTACKLLEQWLRIASENEPQNHCGGTGMDFSFALSALEQSTTYPRANGRVTVKQTHISVVAILDEVVYKLRKPVRLAFLDFSTLELRKEDCEREVVLNRRLAPDVYLGVVPVVRAGSGILVDPLDGVGEVLEWAVKMRRLPAEATLAQRLTHNEVTPDVMKRLAGHVAKFHANAEANPVMASLGQSERILQNAQDNFTDSLAHPEGPLQPGVLEKLRQLTDSVGRSLAPLMDQRVQAGMIRDTHGDLHLDHIYWFPGMQEAGEFVIIDCTEFNEAFRYADPVADIAFACMDLSFRGRRDLSRVLAQAYFEMMQDEEGKQLLSFYTAYRACVRAKVETIQATETEVPLAEREAARQRAAAHWLFALGELSKPSERPVLILFAGLPGTGKSTFAKALMEFSPTDTTLIRTDVVRQELHQQTPELERYGTAMTEKTYSATLTQARESLLQGRRVLVDANFPQELWRERFISLADSLAVPCVFVRCVVADEVARTRLSRRVGDASEADVLIYEKVSELWEPLSSKTNSRTITIDTDAPVESLRTVLVAHLVEQDLA